MRSPPRRRSSKGCFPRLLPDDIDVLYLIFEGKQDLERNITLKLRSWRRPETTFVVVRDQDSAPDCTLVKARLVRLVEASGRDALVRVACRTLEAWVLGDLEALAEAFQAPPLRKLANDRKYRNPDLLGSAYDELRRLVPGYQKIDGARRVGALLVPSRSASTSFKTLCTGLLRSIRPVD